MKKITFYCDICNKEIKDPKENPCINVTVEQNHSWDTPLPRAKLYDDLCVCQECGIRIHDYIRDITLDMKIKENK